MRQSHRRDLHYLMCMSWRNWAKRGTRHGGVVHSEYQNPEDLLSVNNTSRKHEISFRPLDVAVNVPYELSLSQPDEL